MLWSAGFFVFKLKWKMDDVLIDGECVWLMDYVFETLVVFIIWCLFILYVMLYLKGITLVKC